MVIYIIGLSGSGKTYLAKRILKDLGNLRKIHIDGDEVRKYLTYNLGYSYKDRRKNSIFTSDLCKFLEEQSLLYSIKLQRSSKRKQKEI